MPLKVFMIGSNSGLPYQKGNVFSFSSLVQDLGHQLVGRLEDRPDVLVCVDFHPKFTSVIKRARNLGIRTVLVKQEPSVTAPIHKIPNPRNLFDFVIKRGDPQGQPIFNTFQEWDTRYFNGRKRVQRAVAINADKWSAVNGELYSFRRLCYGSDKRIDLYGHGWNDSNWKRVERLVKECLIAMRFSLVPKLRDSKYIFFRPLNYLGRSDDKMRTLSRYKVSLVIENSAEYMSEKLVDALLAGCIPVYVGADPKRFGIPQDLYFFCDKDLSQVKKSITLALELDFDQFQSRVQSWIQTAGVREFWEVKSVTGAILEHIECRLQSRAE